MGTPRCYEPLVVSWKLQRGNVPPRHIKRGPRSFGVYTKRTGKSSDCAWQMKGENENQDMLSNDTMRFAAKKF